MLKTQPLFCCPALHADRFPAIIQGENRKAWPRRASAKKQWPLLLSLSETAAAPDSNCHAAGRTPFCGNDWCGRVFWAP